MNTNFIWHNDKSNHVFYVPFDQVKTLETKNLEKDFVQKVTKDGRTIYLLKDSTLPEHVKPLFESVDQSELKSIQQRVAKENSALNEKQPLSRLPGDMVRSISKTATPSAGISFAHATKRLRDLIDDNPNEIKKNKDIMKFAADDNNLEVLKWAFDQKAPTNFQYIADRALEHGNIEMIEWVKSSNTQDITININTSSVVKGIEKAAKNGNEKFIDFIMEKFEITSSSYHAPSMLDIAHSIGKSGNADTLKKFDEKYKIPDRIANKVLNRGGLSDEVKLVLAEKAARYRRARGY